MTKRTDDPGESAGEALESIGPWRAPLRADFLTMGHLRPTWPGVPQIRENPSAFTVTRRPMTLTQRRMAHGRSRQQGGLLRARAVTGRFVQRTIDLRVRAGDSADTEPTAAGTSDLPSRQARRVRSEATRSTWVLQPMVDSGATSVHPRRAAARSWSDYVQAGPAGSVGRPNDTGRGRGPQPRRAGPTADQLQALLVDANEESNQASAPVADLRVRRRGGVEPEQLSPALTNQSDLDSPEAPRPRVRGAAPPTPSTPDSDNKQVPSTVTMPLPSHEHATLPPPPVTFPRGQIVPQSTATSHSMPVDPDKQFNADSGSTQRESDAVDVVRSEQRAPFARSRHVDKDAPITSSDRRSGKEPAAADASAADIPSGDGGSTPPASAPAAPAEAIGGTQRRPSRQPDDVSAERPDQLPSASPARDGVALHARTPPSGVPAPAAVTSPSVTGAGHADPSAVGQPPQFDNRARPGDSDARAEELDPPGVGQQRPAAVPDRVGALTPDRVTRDADLATADANTATRQDSAPDALPDAPATAPEAVLPRPIESPQTPQAPTGASSGVAPIAGSTAGDGADDAGSTGPPPLYARSFPRTSRTSRTGEPANAGQPLPSEPAPGRGVAEQQSSSTTGHAWDGATTPSGEPLVAQRRPASPDTAHEHEPSPSPSSASGISERIPVPPDVRRAVAQTTGQAPTSVPIRRGAAVDAEARALKADAFTRSGVIHAPGTAPLVSLDDRRLLAHEVTHLVQQSQHGTTLPAEGSPGGQALERQAMRTESALALSPGPVVPARRGAPKPNAPEPEAPNQQQPGDGAGRRGSSAGTPSPREAAAPLTPGGSSSPAMGARSMVQSSVALGAPTQALGDISEAGTTRSPADRPGSESSRPASVPSRPLPATVPASRALQPRTARVQQPPPTAQPALGTAHAPATQVPVGHGVQRRASRTTSDATIGASAAAQEDFHDAPTAAAGNGSRSGTGIPKDTTRDQEWLMRHAQALYPLLRTMLRAELLRDHERRGHMLKGNF